MMKQKYSTIVIIIFSILISTPFLLFAITGELSVGLEEKREPTSFPTQITNDLGTQLDAYLNDHAPYRKTIIESYSKFIGNFNGLFAAKTVETELKEPVKLDEISYFDLKGIYREKLDKSLFYGVPEDSYKTCKEKLPSDIGYQVFFNSKWKSDVVLYADSEWMFLTTENNLDYYMADNLLSETDILDKAEKLKTLQDRVIQNGSKIVYLAPPNKEQVYQNKMTSRAYQIQNNFKRVDRFAHYLNTHTEVNYHYVQKDLLFASNDNNVFYRYDAHWNQLGAYIGTRVAMDALGLEMPLPEKKDIVLLPNNRHDLADLAGIKKEETYTLSVRYKPEVTYDKVASERSLETFQSSNTNGKSILVIGDSFRDNMREFVAKDFETTTFIHFFDLYGIYNQALIEGKMLPLRDYDYIIIEAVERYDNRMFDYAINSMLQLY